MDLTLPGHTHVPLATISPALAERTLTCVAPSKTFNLAGLSMSLIVAGNADLLARYEQQFDAAGLEIASLFGTVALEEAYRSGDEWLDQLLEYLAANVDFAERFIRERMPALRFVRPEGTYLALIDCRGLGMPQKELDSFFLRTARVYFDSGPWFGEEATGFERINLACPRATLTEALERIERAVNERLAAGSCLACCSYVSSPCPSRRPSRSDSTPSATPPRAPPRTSKTGPMAGNGNRRATTGHTKTMERRIVGTMRKTANMILALVVASHVVLQAAGPAIPAPDSVFGFKPGADNRLATYDQTIAYLKTLAAASRVDPAGRGGQDDAGPDDVLRADLVPGQPREDRPTARDRPAPGASSGPDRRRGAGARARRSGVRPHRRRLPRHGGGGTPDGRRNWPTTCSPGRATRPSRRSSPTTS